MKSNPKNKKKLRKAIKAFQIEICVMSFTVQTIQQYEPLLTKS